jgi:hypothetical protein
MKGFEIELFKCTVPKLFDKREILRTVSNTGNSSEGERSLRL